MDYEKKHQEDLERLREFRLLDDTFMTKVFEDPNCARLLLRIILERKDLEVTSVQTQSLLKNLQGHSVWLDIRAEDTDDRMYDVEVQRDDRGAIPKRARYHSALMDANVLKAGEDYENLVETCVIFITEHDVLAGGLPIYHIERSVQETGKPFLDEAHIIYVNAEITDDTELGRLMQDFRCKNAEEMHYPELANRVRFFKTDQKGVKIMCEMMENLRKESFAEGRAEGRAEGISEEKRSTSLRMFEAGFDIEKISLSVGESQETVSGWLRESGKIQ